MVSFDVINFGVDAVMMSTFFIFVRAHINRLSELDKKVDEMENKIKETLTEDETSKMISHKIANSMVLIQYKIDTLTDSFNKIVKVSVRDDIS